jgi:hypothetical protein
MTNTGFCSDVDAKCHYADFHYNTVILPSVIMQSIIMLSFIMLNSHLLIMLSVVFSNCYSGCHYLERRFAECRIFVLLCWVSLQ